MTRTLKIGILLTRAKAEKKKDELVSVRSKKRPWMADNVPKGVSIQRNGIPHVPGDVSVGLYVQWNWKNVKIDFIHPHEVSPKRLKQNDINFTLIYDILESFHVDPKPTYRKFKDALKTSSNVFPPYYYQKFINNKCSYIMYLGKKRENVIPTYCMMNETFVKRGITSLEQTLTKKLTQWGDAFIAKPVYGQESKFFKKFKRASIGGKPFRAYVKKVMSKYPGIVFQKYIEGFDKKNPEIRMYFIGNEYCYSIVTNDKMVKIPRQENGTQTVPHFKALIQMGHRVVRKLPPIKIQGTSVPRLLTRVDVACGPKFAQPWLVNEVEFVPSLYIEDINFIPEIDLGDQMMAIAKKIKKK